ncbi:MAG: hypothetical protein KatS3mg035_0295 [Bacteroidia bacterium]|nr:MAG: hypothetical protein KatS3mg035_0295 [Bacteroidia bacterium]
MLNKIQDFLYDFIGIIVPGLIFILLVGVYWGLYEQVSFNALIALSKNSQSIDYIEKYLLVVIFFIAYFVGHLIIMLSRIQYEICSKIFDWGILKYFHFDEAQPVPNKRDFFSKWFLEIFSYKPLDYSQSNEDLKKRVLDLMSEKLNFKFQDKWYTIYKMSSIIANQEQILNRVNNYFAKYTFFKSMAFILWCHQWLLLFLLFYNFHWGVLLFCFINFLFWLTFHSAYKNYWTICGDESLLSLFYYLSKNKYCNDDKHQSEN